MARNRFMSGLFQTKKASPKDAIARAGGLALGNGGMPLDVAGPWDMEKGVKQGLERVGMVYRCVDAIAQSQSRIPMDIRKIIPGVSRYDAQVVEDKELWNLLNFRANSYETSQAFRYRLSATLLLSRRGAFVEMVRGASGKVEELHLMMPGSVKPIPHPKTFVSGYEIMRGDYVVDEVEPERVCWIKIKPHPMDPYQQLTPLMAAGISADTDFLARNFNRQFLANDGRPGMLITIQGQLQREDAEEIKARFQGGYNVAGRTSVIEADGIDAVDLAANPRDLQWQQLIDMSKTDIQLIFGVPESVMGNASGRTFDNADAERENFYIDTIQPHCDPISMGLDPITGDTSDDIVIAYDYSQVDVLQRVAARKRAEVRDEVAAGLKTIDDYMEETGREPWNVVGTRVLFHTSGIAIAKNPEDQAGIMEYQQIGAGPGEGLQMADAAEQGAMEGFRSGMAEQRRAESNTYSAQAVADRRRQDSGGGSEYERRQGGRNANSGNRTMQRALRLVKSDTPAMETKVEKARTRRKDADPDEDPTPARLRRQRANQDAKSGPYMALRYKMEGIIEGQVTQWDLRQGAVVSERLGHVKSRKGTRHWDTEEKKFPKTQKCKYCAEQATKRIVYAEGRAYIPVCDGHVQKGKDAAAHITPDGSVDPSNIDRVVDIKSLATPEQRLENFNQMIGETKKLDPKYAVDEKQWTKELVDGMAPFIRKAMIREARSALKDMEAIGAGQIIDLPEDAELPDLLDGDFGEVMRIVETAAKNQTSRLEKTIERMDGEGAELKDIMREVRMMTGTRSQWRKQLSMNVVTTAVEAARSRVYESGGSLFVKEWNCQHDNRTRTSHLKADGQKRPGNKPFNVGGSKMMQPGDMTAPIHETANCRCWLSWYPSAKLDARLEEL